MTKQQLIGVLKLASEALEHSKPQMAHYPEPCERHEAAKEACRRALAELSPTMETVRQFWLHDHSHI